MNLTFNDLDQKNYGNKGIIIQVESIWTEIYYDTSLLDCSTFTLTIFDLSRCIQPTNVVDILEMKPRTDVFTWSGVDVNLVSAFY